MTYSLPFNITVIFSWKIWIMLKINSASLLHSVSLLCIQHRFEIIQPKITLSTENLSRCVTYEDPLTFLAFTIIIPLLMPKSLKRTETLFNSLLPLVLVNFSHTYPVCITLRPSEYALSCVSLLAIRYLSVLWMFNIIL